MAAAKKAIKVTGAAVVLRTKSGSERYLYGGASVIADEFTEDSVKHAKSIGLIGEVDVITSDDAQQAAEKATRTKAATAAKKTATDAAAALAAAVKERDALKAKGDAKPEDVTAAEAKVTELETAKTEADAKAATAAEAAK